MIKLVVFDWNGTLLADTNLGLKIDNKVMVYLGAKPITRKHYSETFDFPVSDFLIANGCNKKKINENTQKVAEMFHLPYEEEAKKCRTRKNTKKILNYLKKNKIKAIILSNHTINGINNQVTRLKIKDYFTKVLANPGITDSMSKTSKLNRLRSYLKNKKYKPNEILILGDTTEEIKIAKELKIISISITGGVFSTKRLKAKNPDYIINNLNELIKIIKGAKNES